MVSVYHEFAQRMESTLLTQGFQQVRGGAAFPAVYSRQEGAVRYAFALWDADELGVETLTAQEAAVVQTLQALHEEDGARSVILFNAVCAAHGAAWASRLDKQEAFYNQPVYTIEYLVCFEEEQLRFHPDAPASMLHADVWLSDALHNKGSLPASRVTAENKPAVKQEWLVYLILVLNALVLTLMEMQGGSTNMDVLLRFGALERDLIVTNGEYWRIGMAMFMHIGVTHFLYNGLSLYVFGTRLERHFGRGKFILIYLVTGVAGNLVQLIISDAVCAGASGAIYGLMGAALALTQRTRKSVDGLSFYIMLIFVVVGIAQGLVTPGIGNGAHIGGMIAGYLMGFVMSGASIERQQTERQQTEQSS